jgi:hypothetical protein
LYHRPIMTQHDIDRHLTRASGTRAGAARGSARVTRARGLGGHSMRDYDVSRALRRGRTPSSACIPSRRVVDVDV